MGQVSNVVRIANPLPGGRLYTSRRSAEQFIRRGLAVSRIVILSFVQVRQMLGISDSTLRRLLRRGDLRACRVGRQWRFEETDLKDYFAAHANRAALNRVAVPMNSRPGSIGTCAEAVCSAHAIPSTNAEVLS
jgi:excisionase family DNA binding protein